MVIPIFLFVFLSLNCFRIVISGSFEYAKVNLTLLKDYPNARCLDGSTAGYYFQEALSSEHAKKYVLVLAGGGECGSEKECQEQTTDKHGSSKYFPNPVDTSSWFFGDEDCKHNPDFCGWNHVYNPYCSQDLHSGQKTEMNSWGVLFAGHHILSAILDDLEDQLRESTEILVTGASAGGLGTWMNVDWIAQRYPQARVTGATVAGMYFYATYYDGPNATVPSLVDFREEAWPNTYALYDSFVDEDCAKAMPAYACMILNNSLPYIDTDVFVIQSETDQVVLEYHDGLPRDYLAESPEQAFMHEWHTNMSIALVPLLMQETVNANGVDRKLGAFAAACYTHTDFTASHPFIQNLNYYGAFHRFYFSKEEGNLPSTYLLVDDCGELCNPTCQH